MDTNTTIEDIFPSKFLKASDFDNKTVVFTIKNIDFELVGRNNERKAVIAFNETPKKLVMNHTNAISIGKLYGSKVTTWVGKRIYLYSALVAFGNEMKPGIRVREEIPAQQAKPEIQPVDEISF
jgi:hypothetical protein